MLILMFIIMLFFFITILMKLLYIIFSKKMFLNREKSMSFECGFDPMNKIMLPFSVPFYLISIIFLIFDIEFILLIPMIPSIIYSPIINWLNTSLIIMLILSIGLYIELNESSLNWLF